MRSFICPRLVDEFLLDRFLELLGPVDGLVGLLVEPAGQHRPVDVVLAQLLGHALAGGFSFDVGRGGLVAGHDGAFARQLCPCKDLVELAGLVDAARDQHGVAAPVHQARAGSHVEENVGDDLVQPIPAGEHLAQRTPALLELGAGQIGQSPGLGLEPLVDPLRRGKALVDVARLVAQIQHHAVRDRLVELVGVDVAAEDLDALPPVRLQQRRAGEADEQGLGQDGRHRSCSSPDCVRWHSSTNTYRSPLGLKPGGSACFTSAI